VRASCHQRQARLAVVCLASFALFLAATRAHAGDPATVHDQVAGLRSANAGLASNSQKALLQVYSLDARLGQAERRVAALAERSAQVEAERALAAKQLERARADFQKAEDGLAARLRQLYIEGDVDPLAVLLGAQSLDEVVSALDGLDRLASQDKDIVAQLAHAKMALRTASARLSARQGELQALLADARASRASIESARNARAAYLAGLRNKQALNRAQIDRLTAQAAAAETQSQELTSGSGGGGGNPVPPPPPASGSKMTVSSTGYCLEGYTATGVPTSPGVVAVDPTVIPLGTRMYVPGYGEGVAADTGSAVKGRTIDVWFSSCADAMAWGRRTVTITLH
jgi:3D (Asp-Asp-Asp) domain-containing protein/peptidoglycan hydrolase CwlO-like protein